MRLRFGSLVFLGALLVLLGIFLVAGAGDLATRYRNLGLSADDAFIDPVARGADRLIGGFLIVAGLAAEAAGPGPLGARPAPVTAGGLAAPAPGERSPQKRPQVCPRRRRDLSSPGRTLARATTMPGERRDPIWTLMGILFKAHPWHGVPIGPDAPRQVNAYIEIVPTDTVKYELDKESGHLWI